MYYNNVIPFSAEKRNKLASAGDQDIAIRIVLCRFNEARSLPACQQAPRRDQIERMKRFIIENELEQTVVVDSQSHVIAGHDMLERLRSGGAKKFMASLVTLNDLTEKCALAGAYTELSRENNGVV